MNTDGTDNLLNTNDDTTIKENLKSESWEKIERIELNSNSINSNQIKENKHHNEKKTEKSINSSLSSTKSKSESSITDKLEEYEAIAPIDVKTCELVQSVAMRKDYEDTIMSVLIDIVNNEEDIPGFGNYPYFRVNPVIKFIPKTDTVSEILSERQLKELHMNLPYYQQYKNLKLLYSPSKHGISMKTFYLNTEDYKTTIIVIKDDDQHIFGGYLSEPIRSSQKFYGTGESFVFTYHNFDRIHTFQATMANEYFIYTDDEIVAMGCDDKNFAFVIRNEFLKGQSRTTCTYKNPVLSSNEEFFVHKFEVWTFDDSL